MSEPEQKPIAWAFVNTDGTIRFIIDDEERMRLWATAHEGRIVPLVLAEEPSREQREL